MRKLPFPLTIKNLTRKVILGAGQIGGRVERSTHCAVRVRTVRLIMESWVSGLNHQFAKLTISKGVREFEFHTLRKANRIGLHRLTYVSK